MKAIHIESENRPLNEWLPHEGSEDLVYLMRAGRARYVVVPLDEGDEESLAIQKNAQLMAHLAKCVESARQGPTKTLAQIKAELSLSYEVNGNGA